MQKLITKEAFITIFKNEEYRSKLDSIILNFFGLDTHIPIEKNEIERTENTLKFVFMINTEEILNIIVKDTQNLFGYFKTFYINLSYREVEKYHELLIPCYWEVYIPYAYKHPKKNPKLVLLAALLYCQTVEEIEKILKKLKVFSKLEIENILRIVSKNI